MLVLIEATVVVIITHPIGIALGDRLSSHLIFLFLAHSVDLLFQEFHLIGVAVPNFVLFPLFVFSALLHFPSVNVETIELLHHL